jgi:glucokinase
MATNLNPILGDLGGSRIRFCERGDPPVDLRKISDRKVREFTGSGRLSQALRSYLKEKGIESAGRELRLALACDVHGDDFSFANLGPEWDFNREELREEFRLSRIRVWNDAEAALYSVVEFFAMPFNGEQHYEIVVPGDSRSQGRFVLLGPGSGLGAAGAYLESRDGEYFWVPVPSEFGNSSGWWQGETLKGIIKDMQDDGGKRHSVILDYLDLGAEKFTYEAFHKREFLVSGPGLMRIYHSLKGTDFETTPDITHPEAIVQSALAGEDTAPYAETLELFCKALARATVDLGLTFTARAGIFLTGSLLNAIGTRGLKRFGYTSALFERRETEAYPHDVPVYLITHPYPELVGIARFRVAD